MLVVDMRRGEPNDARRASTEGVLWNEAAYEAYRLAVAGADPGSKVDEDE